MKEVCHGDKSNAWEGGKMTQNDLDRERFRRELQAVVFKRDNYTCQICGQHGGKLQAHHVRSWSESVELRFDISNCQTLCEKCHYLITFGKDMPQDVMSWGHNLTNLRKGA